MRGMSFEAKQVQSEVSIAEKARGDRHRQIHPLLHKVFRIPRLR
jgi:hypothetical protein